MDATQIHELIAGILSLINIFISYRNRKNIRDVKNTLNGSALIR